MNTLRGLPLLIAIILCLLAFTHAAAQSIAVDPTAAPAWPMADVALSDGPGITRGRLENGLRYVVLPRSSVDRQISLRLVVKVGSLHENDDERGFAHFVEHMAFNGTKNFPAGALVKFLQRQGAQFGPHINATTSHTATHYKLDLPAAPDSLETGLRVFRDFADGILFERGEVNRERGVILSEERSRNSPEQDTLFADLRFLYGGTRIPLRMPIGETAQIAKADRTALRRFYDAWYRPENLYVIVVGEIDPTETEALIRKHFTSFRARATERVAPHPGEVAPRAGASVAVHASPLAGALITFTSVTHRPPPRFVWGEQLQQFRLRAALAIVRHRLARFTHGEDSPLAAVSYDVEGDFLRYRRAALSVATSPADFPKALSLLEQELRRACEFGFTQDEIERQQTSLRENILVTARAVEGAPSAIIANAFATYAEEDAPMSLVNDGLEAFLQIPELLTPRDCQQALQKLFGEAPPRIFVRCAAAHAPTAETVTELYRTSRATPVEDRTPDEADAAFAYEDFGPPGEVAEKTHLTDLDTWQIRLGNEVRVNLKRSALEPGKSCFVVRFGYGAQSQPANQPGLANFLSFLWNGGTGRHTAAEFNRMTDGLDRISFNSAPDALVLSGELPSARLPRALRQLSALIGDPAFRPDGWGSARAFLRSQTDPLWNRPEGAVEQFVLPLLAGGDRRLGTPGDKDHSARTPDEFRTWIAPQLATGPIEITLVGDFDPDAMLAEIARTFGTLPAREPRESRSFETTLDFRRDRKVRRYYYLGEADRVSRWEFFWRIHDSITRQDRARLPLLAAIFEDRIRDELRERRGSSYRVESFMSWNDAYPGFSFLRCSVEHKPSDREKHTRAVRKLALALAKKGVTADELGRAKAQAIAGLARERATNAYWAENVLADSQQRSFRLDAIRSVESDIAATTVADLNALAARYLGEGRVFHYLIEPSALIPKTEKK